MQSDSSTFQPDPSAYPPRHYRTVLFYGEEGFAKIREAQVTVIGLGGVGAHAAINLARSGIGALHLVDFDTISHSSLNRSPFAEPNDIGRQKGETLKVFLNRSCPDTKVAVTEAFCGEDTLPQLLPVGAPPDLAIDAIDSLNTKVGLLAWCHGHGISVITSMGAAGKWDLGKLRTGDISKSSICPLARKVRSRLKRRGISEGIPAIWSLEKAEAHRPDVPKEVGEVDPPEKPLGSRERNTLASQMTLPGVFGYGLAAMALEIICRKAQP